jgi:hypothetical protein
MVKRSGLGLAVRVRENKVGSLSGRLPAPNVLYPLYRATGVDSKNPAGFPAGFSFALQGGALPERRTEPHCMWCLSAGSSSASFAVPCRSRQGRRHQNAQKYASQAGTAGTPIRSIRAGWPTRRPDGSGSDHAPTASPSADPEAGRALHPRGPVAERQRKEVTPNR